MVEQNPPNIPIRKISTEEIMIKNSLIEIPPELCQNPKPTALERRYNKKYDHFSAVVLIGAENETLTMINIYLIFNIL